MIRVQQCFGGKRCHALTATYHIDPQEAVRRILAAFADVRHSNGESAEEFKFRQKLRDLTRRDED